MASMDTGGRRLHLVWRIAIVFGAATLIWLFIHWMGDALFGSGYDRGRHVASAVAATALAVPMVVLAYRHLDRLPWSGLRRASPGTVGRLLLLGMAGYLIPAGLAVAAITATGGLTIGLRGSLAEAVLSVLALVVLVFLYEALPEELVFRGYLFRNLATALPRWAAVLAQAALFTLFGVVVGAAGSVDRIVLFFAFAYVQGVIRAVTDTLWVPVGFHLAFQTAEQIVGPFWDRFAVSDLDLLQQIALGLIPLALGVFTVQALWGRTGDPSHPGGARPAWWRRRRGGRPRRG
ncbi:CPBP family intramembrane glutamic endopeptidase [Micromonospora sp. CPCC 206061]|uniref:CPBP family intramembrane glutamic endopeptidase n=1 Tax=Micromonospora sp. CPCC 206061 TaxID=3122410 RepID=UPI002FEE8475